MGARHTLKGRFANRDAHLIVIGEINGRSAIILMRKEGTEMRRENCISKDLANVNKLMPVLALCSIIMTGCVKWEVTKPIFTENIYYSARITPIDGSGAGFVGFELYVENKTDKEISIIWDKTLYLRKGFTNLAFLLPGVLYEECNSHHPPDIVFRNSVFHKKIWPCDLLSYHVEEGRRIWDQDIMPEGENGVYLTVEAGGQEHNNKITVNLTKHDP